MEIKCPDCGNYYKDSLVQCPECITPVKESPKTKDILKKKVIPGKKCKYCAMMIPKEAKICPHCRKKMPMSAPKIIIISVIGFLLIWYIFIQPSMTSTPRTPSPVTVVPGQAKPITWKYGSSKDEMSGNVRKFG